METNKETQEWVKVSLGQDDAKVILDAISSVGKEKVLEGINNHMRQKIIEVATKLPEKDREYLLGTINNNVWGLTDIQLSKPSQIFAYQYRFYPKIKKMILTKAKRQGKYPKKRKNRK